MSHKIQWIIHIFNKPIILTMYTKLLLVLFLVMKTTIEGFPKIVWTYWDQGFSEDDLAYLFIINHKYLSPDWDIRPLDRNSAQKWLNTIPGYQGFPKNIRFSKYLPFQQGKSDFIRMNILKQYGGVWLDWNFILTEGLDKLHDLINNPNVINKYGEEPEVFMFYMDYYGSNEIYLSKQNNVKYLVFPGFQIGIIAAMPHSKLFNDLLEYFIPRIEKGTIVEQYFMKNNSFIQQAKQLNIKIGGLKDVQNYLYCQISLQNVIQLKQRELDSKRSANQDQERKLAINYYNIWVQDVITSTRLIEINVIWNDVKKYKLLAHNTEAELRQKKLFPNFGVEMNIRYIRSLLNPYRLDYLFIYKFPNQLWACPQNFYIQKDSVLNQYLLKFGNLTDRIVKEKVNLIDCPQQKLDYHSKMRITAIIVGVIVTVILIIIFIVLMIKLILKLRKSKVQKNIIQQEDFEMTQQPSLGEIQ